MCQINHLPPDRMTPEQRRNEIAGLLAAGLARLRDGKFAQFAETSEQRAVSLGFSAHQSVHRDPANMKIKES
ncbi:hypothetical protein SAMN04515620_11372 [Collimonas sp. OK607]|uniref:hypothetical protein n=1 Tax=Collimonas sp. OK607 TaxID=1798194 RepID=UPI0008E3A57B|nr:hypothetical protein [Collimonas sp. OK607]SFB02998.1 hypothetical protein SAMN04515620_11372 [Collimonas sp. OK607]